MSSQQTNALCCECGQLRQVRDSFRRYDDNFSGELDHNAAFWRVTVTLKCAHCRQPTRHAMLRIDEYRDYAEEQERAKLRKTTTRHPAQAAQTAEARFERLQRELLRRIELHPPSSWPPDLVNAVTAMIDAAYYTP